MNAAGGVNGKPVELISLNSESKPDLAASLALRIAGRDDVNVMIGGNFGSTMLSIGSIAQRQRIPHVTSTGLVDDGQRAWKYTFFTLVDFVDAAKAMLAYAKKKGYRRIGIMRLEREYGELGSKNIRKYAPEYGLEVVAEERGADGDRDFTAQLTKIREANPDFVVVWFANPGGSLVLKNARQLNLRVPMVGPVSMDSVATANIAGPAARRLRAHRADCGQRGARPSGRPSRPPMPKPIRRRHTRTVSKPSATTSSRLSWRPPSQSSLPTPARRYEMPWPS